MRTNNNLTSPGFTLVELLTVVALLSILAGIGITAIQQPLDRYRLNQDARLLLHTLESAKNLAMISHSTQEVRLADHQILLSGPQGQYAFALSGRSTITLAQFPRADALAIQFTPSGSTRSQNGTFTLSSPRGYKVKLIINQEGRAYMT